MSTYRKSNISGQVVTSFTVDDASISTAKLAAGAVTSAKRSLLVRNETGGSLSAGDLVYVSSWSETHTRALVSKADADAAGARATWVMQGTLGNSANGLAYKQYRLTAQNTNGASVGDPCYLSTTAGAWTLTAPTGADDINQIVGRVAVVHASTGVVEMELDAHAGLEKVGTNEVQTGALTAAKLASQSVTPVKLGLAARNESGGTLSAGDLVYVSGWNETEVRPLLSKADADVAGARASYVIVADILNNANGTVGKQYRLTGVNTNGATVGDPVYLHTTAGGWTLSAPSGADDINQVVGRVAVVHASTGEVEFDLASNNLVLVGTNELQALAVTGAKIAATTVTQAKIAANALDGTIAADVADVNVIGGLVQLFRIKTPGGVTADTDVVVTHKIRVLDVWCVNAGAGSASDTITVKNGSTAITDAIDVNDADKTVSRAGTIDDAQFTIAAGGTLKVTETDGGGNDSPAVDVYVLAVRVA